MRPGNSFTLILFSVFLSLYICTFIIPEKINISFDENYPKGWHEINSKYGKSRIRVKDGFLYASGGKQRFIYVADE